MSNQRISINGCVQSSESFDWLNDSGYKYGYGCFETMRCVNGCIPFIELHYERLITGLSTLGISYDITCKHICQWIQDLYHALETDTPDMVCRLYVSGGEISLTPSFISTPNTVITLSGIPPKITPRGVSVTPITLHEYYRIKSMNYAHHIQALRKASDWPIYIDSDGMIIDSSIFSVGMVTESGVVMAEHSYQLPSISRQVLLNQRSRVACRPIHQSEITSALGMVGCNSIMGLVLISGVAAAKQVMSNQIGQCPIRLSD